MKIFIASVIFFSLIVSFILAQEEVQQQQFTLKSYIDGLISSATPENINDNDDDERGWTRLHKIAYYSPSPKEDITRLFETYKGQIKVENPTNGSSECERTALMVAAESGNLEAIQALLESSSSAAEPDVRDNHERTALFYAAQYGRTDIVKYLLNRAVETKSGVHAIRSSDFMRITPFLIACQSGAYTVVEEFLNFHNNQAEKTLNPPYNLVDARDAFGQTCLHLAAAGGENIRKLQSLSEEEQLRQLHQEKFDIATSATAFDVDFVKVAEAVLKIKPDMLDTVNSEGQDAFYIACAANNFEIVKFILNKYQESSVVEKRLVEQPSVTAESGETYIHALAKFGRLNLATYLLKKNSFIPAFSSIVDMPDSDGRTPLLHAVINGHASLVDFFFTLKNQNVDLYHKDRHTMNAFLHASLNGHLEVLQRLFFFDPSLIYTSKDQYAHNALHLACWEGKSLAAVKFLVFHTGKTLLKQGRDIDILYPLHFAVQSRGPKALEIVEYLVDEVDVELTDIMDGHAKTPVDYAVQLGKKEMEDFMRKGKSAKQENKCGGRRRQVEEVKQQEAEEEEKKNSDL